MSKEVKNWPEVLSIHKTDALHVLLVKGEAGQGMRPHFCDREVFLFVHKGNIVLEVAEELHPLGTGNSFMVPAHKVHLVKGETSFEFLLVMPGSALFSFVE